MDEQRNSMAEEPTAEIEIRSADGAVMRQSAEGLTEAQAETAVEGAGASVRASSDFATREVAIHEVSIPEISNQVVSSAVQRASHKIERPFRVKLRGAVMVLVRLPNKRDIRAAFHQLSVTGGVVHVEKPLDEKLGVEMIFHIGGETIREKAQMLFPMWATQGWMQPFRFVEMAEANRASLDAHLKAFMGESAKGAAAGA